MISNFTRNSISSIPVVPKLKIPTYQQILTDLYKKYNLPDQDPQWLINEKKLWTKLIDETIKIIEGLGNTINIIDTTVTEINIFIEYCYNIIEKLEKLFRLLNALIKGLQIALGPFTSFLANAPAEFKIGEAINFIKGSIKTGLSTTKTCRKWLIDFIEDFLIKTTKILESMRRTQLSIIIFLNNLKAFIDAISIDMLKALLGITNTPPRTVLDNYASTIDTPEPVITPTSTGDPEDIKKRIGDIVDPENPPPRFVAELTNQELTRLKFILDEQDKIKKENTKDYLESFIETTSLEQLNLTLAEIRRLISLNLLVLTREDEEYLKLLEQYNLTPTPEEQPIVQIPLRPGEFERYGLNRDNAVVSYERRNT
jgi:hypothetical protein